MEELPKESQVSYKKGVWFVFHAENHTIRAWASLVNGKYHVYLDDKLISKGRSFKMITKVKINSSSGDEYEMTFNTLSITKGPLEFRVSENGTVTNIQHLKYIKVPRPLFKRLVIPMIAGVLIGVLTVIFNYPKEVMISLTIFVVLINLLGSKIMTFEIEEIEN